MTDGIDLLKVMGWNRNQRREFRLGEVPTDRQPMTGREKRRRAKRARAAARSGDYSRA